jgi:hypothetical protein
MPWLIALNVALYLGAAVLFFTGYGILALICFIVAALLSLGLSGGKIDAFDIF